MMKHEAVATGRTVNEAIQSACDSLGVSTEDVEFEVLELPSKRLLGLLGASEAKVKVSYEESIEEKAKRFLSKLLPMMGLNNVSIFSEEKEENISIKLEGDGLGVIIGHRGETLDALQYLVALEANRGEEQYKRVSVDTGNYREKREKTLTSLARRIAINAVKTKRNTTLEPMNPYERRIIHTAVQEIHGATSWSVGEEPNRRVIIGAEGAQQGNKNHGDRPRRYRQ